MTNPAAMLALALATTTLAAAAPAGATGLEPYRWKARPVLIFAPSHGDRQVVEQLGRLTRDADALADRDMPVLVVTGRDVADLAGGDPTMRPDGETLRRTYRVPDGTFAVVLVGKDGGEKFRSDKLVDPSKLTELVDTMPMRAEEAGAAK